ncbi:hypothetical protein HH310_14315 [Actinoplanes sp. TBRC 11911]|uniref:hypothetical protein n=1 Tax=Actinoplanes sp. TBRC 11911 TaxID=2729386 RepID=UPI00145DB7C3|nr:hypothetical protein [Actinoplanes sp. TBRC 11911]NMO52367.1 hypothetical protein [Actinoplanes sp. TBRC 11911]
MRKALILACLLIAAVVLTPGAAQAHPFGDPQTVAVALDGSDPSVVHVRWKVGGLDDLTLLGVALGVLPPDRVLLDGATVFQPSDAATIGPSAQFAGYLTKQITVADREQPCPAAVQRPGDLVKNGVTIDYRCDGPIGTATIAVRTLTDLNPAYKTLASGPDGEHAVYGQGNESHEWVLSGADGVRATQTHPARNAALQIAIVLAGVIVVAGAVAVLTRRRKRKHLA